MHRSCRLINRGLIMTGRCAVFLVRGQVIVGSFPEIASILGLSVLSALAAVGSSSGVDVGSTAIVVKLFLSARSWASFNFGKPAFALWALTASLTDANAGMWSWSM